MAIEHAIDNRKNTTNRPTGRVIMFLTIDSMGEIHEGACLNGPNYCGLKVYEIPLNSGETWLSLRMAKEVFPIWWGKKHKDAAMRWLQDKQLKLEIAYARRRREVQPSGLRNEDEYL